MSHGEEHEAEGACLARALAAIAASHPNIVEAELIVRLGCGFEATLAFTAGRSFDTRALLQRAIDEIDQRIAAAKAEAPGTIQ